MKAKDGFASGDKICVGVRPERIFYNQPQNLGTFNALSGRITRIVFRGDDFDITVKIGENEIRYTEPTINYEPRNVGDVITLYFRPEDTVIYHDDEQECSKGEDYEAKEKSLILSPFPSPA